ncbi:MAG: AMP-binding protein [Acidimicrobiia bacterium]|nr:AMP-binding protein [Acidimicrobiia bacterium]
MTVTRERPATPSVPLSISSLPARVRQIAEEQPDLVALREKDLGIWQETTYAGYWEMIQTVGAALLELGVRPEDKVAIHSENRKAWVFSELGAIAIGAISVGIYPTNPAAEVEYLLRHSETVVLVAEDQEQVDKALLVKNSLPNLRHIIYLEPRGVVQYDDPMLLYWDDFVEMGRRRLADNPDEVARMVDEIDPEAVACLVYTSGTTGPPKGAMISHRNMVYVMDHVLGSFVGRQPKRKEVLSYLPLCHIAEKLYTEMFALNTAATVNFAESIETVTSDLREVQPTVFLGVPRIWEKMQAGVVIRMMDASFLKRTLFKAGLAVGMWNADRILERGSRGVVGNVLHGIFYVLVYRSLLDKLGMRHCLGPVSGAAPIAPEVLKFFMALGLEMREGYGQTENTAYATVNREGDVKLGTVGPANVGAEVKLAEDGEIMVRHPGVFMGYFKNEEATRETITPDGWLHTGDVGEWDGEHLRIVDRKKDIIITAGGKNISPSEIENKLKVSPFIKEAIVLGDRRKFVSALIGIEYDTVSNWALRRGITFTTYRDLSEKPEVRELVKGIVDDVNRDFANVEQVRQFRLIPKELDHEDGELTATQKVKRSAIAEMFEELINDIYGSA